MHIKPCVLYQWSPSNDTPFCPSNKSQAEGNGERKMIRELAIRGHRVVKNPENELGFPDIVSSEAHSPFGEVKAFSKKRESSSVKLGHHTAFVEYIRIKIMQKLIDSGERDASKIYAKTAKGILAETITSVFSDSEWNKIQDEFFREYFNDAGGRVFLVSEEGFTLVTQEEVASGLVKILRLPKGDEVIVSLRKELRPFK